MANANFTLDKNTSETDPFAITELTEVSLAILSDPRFPLNTSVRLQVEVSAGVYKSIGEPLNEYSDMFNVRLNEGTYRLKFIGNGSSDQCAVFISPFTTPA